jgi:uncharacterized protein YrzB (UPF0473 family)
MSDEYGSDFISVTDDDGNEYQLEHLDTIEVEEETYMAFLPADMEETNEDYGVLILKVTEEDGDEMFVTVDDERELNHVYEKFMERLFAEDED